MKTAHEIFKENGITQVSVANALGITHGAVSQWRLIPAERAHAIEQFTGIQLHVLRPDLWPEQFTTQDGTKIARARAPARKENT